MVTPHQETGVRAAEHEADEVRRGCRPSCARVQHPIDQEDLYSLSELLDAVLNAAKNIVREAEVLAIDPDAPVADGRRRSPRA